MRMDDVPGNPPATPAYSLWISRLPDILLFGLLIIIGLRPLIQETCNTMLDPLAMVFKEIPPASPTTTIIIDLALMLIGGWVWALRRAGYLPSVPALGIGPGAVLLSLAAIASCTIASNQRLAINITLDWLTLPVLAWSLRQLLTTPRQIRLAVAVILASAAANAIQAFDDYYVTNPNTITFYEKERERIWQEQGYEPDDYRVTLLQKRIYDPAAKGFFILSNIAGNYLVLTLLSGTALLIACWKNIPARLINIFLCGLLLWALWLTGSRGALAATVIGFCLWGLLWAIRQIQPFPLRRLYFCGWLLVVLSLAGVAFYGARHDGFPEGSLTYRWWYLQATSRMVQDHPWLGVGSGQYSRYYTRYKEIKNPEEISDPHNFLAHAAAQWGLPGLVGILLMLIGGSYRLCLGSPAPRVTANKPQWPNAPPIPHHIHFIYLLLLMGCIWMLRIFIVGNPDPLYIAASNIFPLMAWTTVAGLLLFVLPDDLQRLGTGIGIALMAFLVHELINFALFVPASAMTFFALFSVAVAGRQISPSTVTMVHPQRFRGPAALTLLMVICMGWLFLRPVRNCWQELRTARQISNTNPARSLAAYEHALAADPLDSTAALEITRLFPLQPRSWPHSSNETYAQLWFSLYQHRDREYLAIYRQAAQLAELESQSSRTPLINLQQAVKFQEEVIARYPTQPNEYLRMGEYWERISLLTGDIAARTQAIRNYQAALDWNARRPGADEVRRYSTAQLADLTSRIERLRAATTPPLD
ncbi:MAG: hypothetical protein HJJLKODD_02244 [Phycisphaerae bacterium]|nr:hypothetical protein [Phycisphaerae bacterium]